MLIQTREQFVEAKTTLLDAELCAVDTETAGFDGRIIGISTHCEIRGRDGMEVSFYFPFRHEHDQNLFRNVENLPIEWLKELRACFGRKNGKWIFHNFKFDLQKFWLEDIDFPGEVYDTMLMSWMIDENTPNDLKGLGERFINETAKFEQDHIKSLVKTLGSWEAVPPDVMGMYAEKDALLTYRLFSVLEPMLVQQEMLTLLPTEIQFCRLLARMEYRGIRIDRDRAKQLAYDTDCWLQSTRETLGFDPAKKKELAHRLFGKDGAGLKPLGLTKSKLASPITLSDNTTVDKIPVMDAAALKQYDHPLPALVLEYRSKQKALSTWFLGFLEKADGEGRLHTTFKQHGTVTTRLSSSNPNVQQIPRTTQEEQESGLSKALVKTLFLPEDDCELWEMDYCIDPTARVLTSDLRWVPAEKLSVGQELIGFDEDLGPNNRWRKSTVESIKYVTQPCYKITTENGPIIASEDHLWVGRLGEGTARKWVKTKDLKPGTSFICTYAQPWEEPNEWEAGFLSGFMDGEGHLDKGTVGFAQNPNATLETTLDCLEDYGFKWSESLSTQSNCYKMWLTGPNAGMRFIGMFRPPRLLAKSEQMWKDRRSWSPSHPPTKVLSVEYLGEQPTVALRTSTRTFVVEGYMSHNSQCEYRLAGCYAKEEAIIQGYADGKDFHQLTADLLNISRQDAKTVNFAVLYGAGPRRLAEQLGVTEAQGMSVLTDFREAYPRLTQVSREAEKAARRGWVRYWDGRRRHFQYSSEYHKAFNSVIQGGAARLMIQTMLRLEKAGYLPHLQVHDSLWFSIPKAELETQSKEIKSIMEWPSEQFPIEFPVDAKRLDKDA